MLAGISAIHQKICDFEKNYYVTFDRSSAVVGEDHAYTMYHLLVREWIQAEISPGRHILSAIAVDAGVEGIVVAPLVLVASPDTYANVEFIDINGSVLASTTAFPSKVKVLDPVPEALFITPSIKNPSIVSTGSGLRISGTLDISVNFMSWDLCDFDFTI